MKWDSTICTHCWCQKPITTTATATTPAALALCNVFGALGAASAVKRKPVSTLYGPRMPCDLAVDLFDWWSVDALRRSSKSLQAGIPAPPCPTVTLRSLFHWDGVLARLGPKCAFPPEFAERARALAAEAPFKTNVFTGLVRPDKVRVVDVERLAMGTAVALHQDDVKLIIDWFWPLLIGAKSARNPLLAAKRPRSRVLVFETEMEELALARCFPDARRFFYYF